MYSFGALFEDVLPDQDKQLIEPKEPSEKHNITNSEDLILAFNR